MDKINYNDWNETEILQQINVLKRASALSFRCSNKLIELCDGKIRISTMREDKTWSEWETINTPCLHIREGMIVAQEDHKLIIRASKDKAYELCSVDDEPWSKDDVANVFKSTSGSMLIFNIIEGRREDADSLTVRPTIPGLPFQVELVKRMGLIPKMGYPPERMFEDADNEYISGNWVHYYPYEKMKKVWTPLQEMTYLESFLKEKCSNIREVDEEKDNESSLLPSHISNNSVKNYTQFTNHYSNYDKTTKNYIIAALLAIFLGFLGAHKFYMGKTIIGIIYILFSWTMIPTILGIFEGFRFLIEGQEKFLSRMSD